MEKCHYDYEINFKKLLVGLGRRRPVVLFLTATNCFCVATTFMFETDTIG